MAKEINTYDELLRHLEGDAVNHIAYYHYTRWECLQKMMEKASCPDGESHRMLLLTRADKTNDGIEEKWPQNYYMACFSLSRYEDVAMWLNYGKRNPDAVRIKITRDAMDDWRKISRHAVFKASCLDGCFHFTEDISGQVKSVKLYGLAYVIPSQHWITEEDGILDAPLSSKTVVQDGNIELGRHFFRVSKDGDYKWVDPIYNGEDLTNLGIPPVFKKRGWAYEREIRLVVELENGVDAGDRIGIAFDGPLGELEKYMCMPKDERECKVLGGKMTPKTKVWDARFPMIQSGPWYEDGYNESPICGFKMGEAFRSEYRNEIKMIFPGDERR